MIYKLPYGKTEISIDISEKYDVTLVKPENRAYSCDILKAIQNPINSPKLSDLAKNKKNAVIIVNDITRPTPTSKFLPFLISELKSIKDIIIVFGLGLHRKQTEIEKRKILGELYGKIKAIEHDINNCVYLGTTSRGTPVEIFEPVVKADLVICTGSIGFHYYAGYSGGAKSILPAVSSKRSIESNHKLMLDPNSFAGNLKSRVRQDIEDAGDILGIDFIFNVVLNDKKEIIYAISGEHKAAHRKGVEFLDEAFKVRVEKSDILIVSAGGFPKDINIFQSHKAIEHCKNAVKEGGSIILVAECKEGYGNKVFEEYLNYGKKEVVKKFNSEFVMGGHKAALLSLLTQKYRIYLVSSLSDEIVRKSFFIPSSLENALKDSLKRYGKAPKITIIPQGVSYLTVSE